MKHLVIIVAAFVVFTGFGQAQVRNTENTLKLAEGGIGEKASIADMEWIAGSWGGIGLGGVSEETWSKPQAGIMIGTHRLTKDEKSVFYEMMMLVGEMNIFLALRQKDGTLKEEIFKMKRATK